MIGKRQCEAYIHNSTPWCPRLCERAGKIEREGKFYCATHDPVAEAARRAASHEKWKAGFDEKVRENALKLNSVAAIRLIAAGHNDPKSLAQSVIDGTWKQEA